MPSDYQQAVPLVRLNIADTHTDTSKRLLTDEQLSTLLEHYDGSTNRASARALRIIAASEALVSKAIRTQDLQTSGDRVAESLRKLAADFDAEADAEEAGAAGGLWLVPNGPPPRAEGEEFKRFY